MSNLEKNTNLIILLIITVIAAVMRFYNYYGWSLSNDELSALNRLRFDNFYDLVNYGIKPDGHPALIQVFLYYWVKVFNDSETSIRFPFVIAGIISVVLSYLIAARWFNKSAALLSAIVISFLQYTILYSQLARPYSFGLLFSLSTVYFWTKIVMETRVGSLEKRKIISIPGTQNSKYYSLFTINYKLSTINYSLFIMSAVLAAMTHYFSALFIVIVYITGLFLIKKKNYLPYILSAAAALILYLPNINIFLNQISIGGIGGPGGWLGKPTTDWLWEFICYSFNDSALLLSIVLLIFILSILINFNKIKLNKFHLICLVWFILPYFIGMIYSIYINPVLQYSLMLFCFPFLLFFIFSFVPERFNYFNIISLCILGTAGIYTTVVTNKYYSTIHNSNFKGIAKDLAEWKNKYDEKNITYTININHPYYIEYYLKRYNSKISFLQNVNIGGKDMLALKKIIDSSNTKYFAFAVLRPSPSEIPDIIQTRYPYLVRYNNYNGYAEDYLFSNDSSVLVMTSHDLTLLKKPFKEITNGFESKDVLWGKDISGLDTLKVNKGKYSYRLEKATEYGPTFEHKLSELSIDSPFSIKVSINAYSKEIPNNIHLVMTLQTEDKKDDFWGSSDFDKYCIPGKWCTVFLNHSFEKTYSPDDKLKIFAWNNKGKTVYIDNLKICIYK